MQGNAGLLRIAIANLIENAVRHTPAGTAITVVAASDRVTISDDGPGMVRGTRGGFRNATAARSDSAGLGLAIVQRIMAAIGGEVEIAQTVPGASVTLRLQTVPAAPVQPV